jgi:hypothetical protein
MFSIKEDAIIPWAILCLNLDFFPLYMSLCNGLESPDNYPYVKTKCSVILNIFLYYLNILINFIFIIFCYLNKNQPIQTPCIFSNNELKFHINILPLFFE